MINRGFWEKIADAWIQEKEKPVQKRSTLDKPDEILNIMDSAEDEEIAWDDFLKILGG